MLKLTVILAWLQEFEMNALATTWSLCLNKP